MYDAGATLRFSRPLEGESFAVSYNAVVRTNYVEQVGMLRYRRREFLRPSGTPVSFQKAKDRDRSMMDDRLAGVRLANDICDRLPRSPGH